VGRTPVALLSPEEAHQLFAGIPTDTLIGLRDRALITPEWQKKNFINEIAAGGHPSTPIHKQRLAEDGQCPRRSAEAQTSTIADLDGGRITPGSQPDPSLIG
jgi:hypothetical protein